jgi:hypothetical protein
MRNCLREFCDTRRGHSYEITEEHSALDQQRSITELSDELFCVGRCDMCIKWGPY